LPHLFERFNRVDAARSAGGIGLGLAIARQIAEHHGGTIEVSSEVGVGSRFALRLPVTPPPPPAGDTPSPDEERGKELAEAVSGRNGRRR
jgi:signal transduction histidine kinase